MKNEQTHIQKQQEKRGKERKRNLLGNSKRRGGDVGDFKVVGNKWILGGREGEKQGNVDEKEEESSR